VVTLADQAGVALRGGHHCTNRSCTGWAWNPRPRELLFLQHPGEVDRFVEVVKEIQNSSRSS